MDTQKQIKDNNYILHSDHAWKYFQKELLDFNKKSIPLSFADSWYEF